jgi:endonuclease/exonuclease/phosphatase family metal-dependent hydrolase
MNHWQQSATSREAAWEYLKHRISPDIALLQEFVPEDKKGNFHYRHNSFGGRMTWGTTVVSFIDNLSPIEFFVTHQGSVTSAHLTSTPSGEDMAFVSIYGIIENGRATPNLHHVLSDITPLLLGDFGIKSIIIGGDFNTSTQWEMNNKRWPGLTPSLLFDRIKDFGLVNVTGHFLGNHVQTYRAKQGDFPWQNDYLFVSGGLLEKISKCEVLDNEEIRGLSDHNPILIELL